MTVEQEIRLRRPWGQRLLSAAARSLPVGSNRFARAFWRLTARPGATPVQVHGGFTMRLDLSTAFHRAFALGLYDRGQTEELVQWIEPGSLFIDVGANVGYYALLAATHTGPRGRVIAFEADPANVDALRDNVVLNGMKHVDVIPAAVGAQVGRAQFVTGEHSVGSTLENAEGTIQQMGPEWVGEKKRVIDVEMTTLDASCAAIVSSWPGRRVMKIDIEGAEPLALRGASQVLSHLDAVFVECNPPALSVHGYQPTDIIRILVDHGYAGMALPHGRGEKSPVPDVWNDWANLLYTRPRGR